MSDSCSLLLPEKAADQDLQRTGKGVGLPIPRQTLNNPEVREASEKLWSAIEKACRSSEKCSADDLQASASWLFTGLWNRTDHLIQSLSSRRRY